MILYISNATDYSIFNPLMKSDKIFGSNQMQKFNSNLITGLSKFDSVIALSTLPYKNIAADRIDDVIDGVRYVAIKNTVGKMHKISNMINLYKEGRRIVREKRPTCIICDAIAVSPCYISMVLAKLFGIPVIGIVTDLPGMLTEPKNVNTGIERMQNFDAYVLLTEEMNAVVNPKGKPHIIMEGLCAPNIPPLISKSEKRIILYTGALWKHDAGIEYFVEGFLKANIDNCELHLYGVGELVSWLQEVAQRYPQVKYMGSVTNDIIVQKQSEATLLVNPRPSDEEFCKYSFPSKTIEYMLSGTPVLMTKLPGIPSDYFNYVYTIEIETVEGICKSITQVLSQTDEELKEKAVAARQYVIENKSCIEQARKIWRLAKEVL